MSVNVEILKDYKQGSNDLLEIFTYPDPVLTKVATEVTSFNGELKKLALDMLDTMYEAPGIGLAAPQVGISIRMLVLDIDFKFEDKTNNEGKVEKLVVNQNPMIFINPVITAKEGKIKYQEGCLSLPKIFEDVDRFEKITLEYQDLDGKKQTIDAEGLLSVCLQHEIDHLDGIVFIDRLSRLKKSFCKKKLLKQKKK